jgi:hypothetical protein
MKERFLKVPRLQRDGFEYSHIGKIIKKLLPDRGAGRILSWAANKSLSKRQPATSVGRLPERQINVTERANKRQDVY